MSRTLLGLFALLALSANAADRVLSETTLPFEMGKDALCFRNADPDLAKTGIPVLGSLGVKKGVCQGMAGIARAFRENVEFLSKGDADSPAEVARLLDRAVRANRAGSREKIQVRGFGSLAALCAANRMAFLKKAVWLNSEIAVSDILPRYLAFNRLKDRALGTQPNPEALRRQLGIALTDARDALREGRYPLVLFYSHVVLAWAHSELQDAQGARRIELTVYDSNRPEGLRTLSYPLASDGLPTASNSMIWVL